MSAVRPEEIAIKDAAYWAHPSELRLAGMREAQRARAKWAQLEAYPKILAKYGAGRLSWEEALGKIREQERKKLEKAMAKAQQAEQKKLQGAKARAGQ